MSKLISKSVLGVLLAAGLQQAQAVKLSCNVSQAGAIAPVATALQVEVNERDKTAQARLGNYFDETVVNEQDDNLAEFAFDSGAEAAVWEKENEDGTVSWTGFVLPENDGFQRIKCFEVE